ncbi:MAG TPA: hypothetical protein PLG55_03580 [Methanospirillum sp.]|jgi:hypothetical protein|uniref:hypothetical protein n=1 Tax=Methanospirillum sp. TaxID=45200 RepID=UPI0009D515DE|nr:hypothetical protein [Methanospirillum sp.]OQB58320.1 MAG: hypothetical protein BWX96_03017 [Bacteroidetes bacterium ADurb.Bin145]HPY59791.1 hypothetical protein [Methanospirillum sp.]
MIPPTFTRQDRACEECVFFDDGEEFCRLHDYALYGDRLERWELEDLSLPCPYHYTPDEMMELIEQNLYLEDQSVPRNDIWTAR